MLPLLCVPLLQVCAVLCYAQQNNVEPFLEPVLLLANAMMVQDAAALAVSGSRGELLSVFLSQLLTFADLCTYADSAVALAAAQCLARLVSVVWKRGRGMVAARIAVQLTTADSSSPQMSWDGFGSPVCPWAIPRCRLFPSVVNVISELATACTAVASEQKAQSCPCSINAHAQSCQRSSKSAGSSK